MVFVIVCDETDAVVAVCDFGPPRKGRIEVDHPLEIGRFVAPTCASVEEQAHDPSPQAPQSRFERPTSFFPTWR